MKAYSLQKRLIILCVLFGLQASLFRAVSMEEVLPSVLPLENFPAKLSGWTLAGEDVLDEATRDLLQPDASVIRLYKQDRAPLGAGLFIGYFKSTQANHPMPHAPTVCLPGAGWKEVFLREIDLASPKGGAFAANEYVLEKSGKRLVVVYWYQNSQRTWANPVWGKVYMLPDFVSMRRSDVAIVRITVNVDGSDYSPALVAARSLAGEAQAALAAIYRPGLEAGGK